MAFKNPDVTINFIDGRELRLFEDCNLVQLTHECRAIGAWHFPDDAMPLIVDMFYNAAAPLPEVLSAALRREIGKPKKDGKSKKK